MKDNINWDSHYQDREYEERLAREEEQEIYDSFEDDELTIEELWEMTSLKEFLRINLTVKEFRYKEKHYFIHYNEKHGRYSRELVTLIPGSTLFESVSDKVINYLNDNKIDVKELDKAYRELGWRR